MAGSMRKMAVYLGLVEDEPLDDDYDDYDEPRRDVRPVPSDPRTVETRSVRTVRYDEPTTSDRAPRAAAPAPAAHPTADNYRITALHPRSYNDARRIGEEFREGTPVIMNLTEMDDGDAKRIVDFAAGLVFGLHGTIERVTNKVFLLSPHNVDVAAEARAQVAQGGFFNQS
jgi:cell division inhibitor SepF